MSKPFRTRRFAASELFPPCLKCGAPVHLDGQSQGWTHNRCIDYPPSERALAFTAAQARARGIEA